MPRLKLSAKQWERLVQRLLERENIPKAVRGPAAGLTEDIPELARKYNIPQLGSARRSTPEGMLEDIASGTPDPGVLQGSYEGGPTQMPSKWLGAPRKTNELTGESYPVRGQETYSSVDSRRIPYDRMGGPVPEYPPQPMNPSSTQAWGASPLKSSEQEQMVKDVMQGQSYGSMEDINPIDPMREITNNLQRSEPAIEREMGRVRDHSKTKYIDDRARYSHEILPYEEAQAKVASNPERYSLTPGMTSARITKYGDPEDPSNLAQGVLFERQRLKFRDVGLDLKKAEELKKEVHAGLGYAGHEKPPKAEEVGKIDKNLVEALNLWKLMGGMRASGGKEWEGLRRSASGVKAKDAKTYFTTMYTKYRMYPSLVKKRHPREWAWFDKNLVKSEAEILEAGESTEGGKLFGKKTPGPGLGALLGIGAGLGAGANAEAGDPEIPRMTSSGGM